MKFSSTILLALSYTVVASSSPGMTDNGRRLDITESCFGSHDFDFSFKGDCSFDSLVDRMKVKINNNEGSSAIEQLLISNDENKHCNNTARKEILLLLGMNFTQVELAKEKVRAMCLEAVEVFAEDPKTSLDFSQIADKGEMFDKNYFDGGTFWNQEYQTNYDLDVPDEPANVLSRDASRVDDIYESSAKNAQIKWPKMPNFENCSMRAAMCCWVTDRQANDRNGNCATPYDERCTDADPADNTDLCAVDFARSGTDSVHMNDGFSLYEGRALDRNDVKEGPVHVSSYLSIPTFSSTTCPVAFNISNNVIIFSSFFNLSSAMVLHGD